MKWEILEDCGNSPKNKMLIDWIVAFVDQKDEMNFVSEDSVVIYKGETRLLSDFEIPARIDEMHLEKSITHGRDGAVLGKIVVGNKEYPFSLFFVFSLGKQPKIKSVECIVDRA